MHISCLFFIFPSPFLSPLDISRSLLALSNPSFQSLPIPHPQPDLKRFWVSRQTRGLGIAIERIEYRAVCWVARRQDVQADEHTQERRVQFAIGQMRARAHPTPGTVAIVRRSGRAIGAIREISVRIKDAWVGEMGGVVVGGPGILWVCQKARGYI